MARRRDSGGDLTPAGFATAVLEGLGIRPTSGNVSAFVGWENAEGGHWHNDARYNPLNTTMPAAGAGNTGTQGNIKQYTDWRQGVRATVQTLDNGRYGGILSALRQSNPSGLANAIGSSSWGTGGGLVARTIAAAAGTQQPARVRLADGGGSTGQPSPSAPTAQPSLQPVFDAAGYEQAQRRALVAQMLARHHHGGTLFRTGLLSTDTPTPADFQTMRQVGVPTSAIAKPGTTTGKLATAIERANTLDRRNNAGQLPYAWGGGHQAKVTNVATTNPLDCSGAVSAVLGLDPRVASQFKAFGSPGDGGSRGITVYAKDTHVLMKINGHFFGTSHANPGGGAGWIPQAAISPGYLSGFTARHLASA